MKILKKQMSELSNELIETYNMLTVYESMDLAIKLMQLKALKSALILDREIQDGYAIPVLEKIAIQLGATGSGHDISITDSICQLNK